MVIALSTAPQGAPSMTRRNSMKYALTAVLASGLVAAPAMAQPIDRIDRLGSPTSSLAGTTSTKKQDLRGEHARDAARQSLQPGQPVFPTYHDPLPRPKPVTSASTDGGGDDTGIWVLIAGGLAGAGIAGAGAVGAARHSRLRARRVAA
jgi:hypothetical protein